MAITWRKAGVEISKSLREETFRASRELRWHLAVGMLIYGPAKAGSEGAPGPDIWRDDDSGGFPAVLGRLTTCDLNRANRANIQA